ncbi:uncharacterized protein MONBRDRAFT_25760 [Monosiga brevicollis MX1]|uniref:Micro-fibrillar-associated protein 1 C-terminal domain-containing protein n=1 Tax=Monosiga brevicollis TaxID=81824 RepID=A9V0C6_MONBE|nr:uncharacterized protein MONBRDRAFT_25760 [Monosiga brevicollis MX1]EDQ88987.1 predicted protein [Monosiga brevicollis MX1]|eukprot:XP_001746092.1 hypothetical protein [Monosiga brevicollis MX1]
MASARGTGGAVPVVNDRGEVSMAKVKVQRYVAGKAPEFAQDGSDDEDFTTRAPLQTSRELRVQANVGQRSSAAGRARVAVIEDAANDSDSDDDNARRRRILAQRRREQGGEEAAPLVSKVSGRSEVTQRPARRAQPIAEIVEEDSAESSDDEEAAERRARILARARAKQEQQSDEAVADAQLPVSAPAGRTPVAEVEESGSESDSSEYETGTDSEEEAGRPLFKPVFISKRNRHTKREEEERMQREAERLEQLAVQKQEAALAAKEAVEELVKSELQAEADATKLNFVDDDDKENDQEAYLEWKLRELKRLKRDREEREQADRERMEIERVHEMTEEEREAYFKANPKMISNLKEKGKMKFLQKYYHRGAFFMDEEHEVFKRDTMEATLEDRHNKEALPAVMQVKKFGFAGRTKYTHLADQDTTDRYVFGWHTAVYTSCSTGFTNMLFF